jgi:hypothetical protein
MEVSGQLHAPATLPWGSIPRYSSDRGLGGHRSRPECYAEEKTLLILLRIEA